MNAVVPSLPDFASQLGASSPESALRWAAVAYAATPLAAGLSAPVWGHLGDTYGRKSMLVRASIGTALTTPLLGLVDSLWQLVLVRLLVGLAGGYSSAAIILIATQSPPARAAGAIGRLSTAILLGGVAGPLIGGLLPTLVGQRQTYIAVSLLPAIAFLATSLWVHSSRPTPDTHAETTPRDVASAPVSHGVAVFMGMTVVVAFATVATDAFVIERIDGLIRSPAMTDAGWAGVAIAVTTLSAAMTAIGAGALSRRYGPYRLVTASLACGALGFAGQAMSDQIFLFLTFRLMAGLGIGPLLPVLTSALREQAAPDRAGRVLGWNMSAIFAGQIIGPLSCGLAASLWGVKTCFSFAALALAYGLILWVSAAPRLPRGIAHTGVTETKPGSS